MTAFQSGARPVIRWLGVAVVCVVLMGAIAIIGGPMLRALNRWADGEPVDLMGFAALLGALGGFLGAAWAIIKPVLDARHEERLHEIREGRQPLPFDPLPASPVDGPRPGENSQ